ncbi:zinc finger protein ZAT11 [Arachis duranensis]|uniref:Zinc finger protein ZAT11 n=1 Tax=Arachis duranensis TaxID=130453 RepID=A0A6P4DKN4_ARADU|nr:zinc finger protein ZAT11 [Arachis duranensis]
MKRQRENEGYCSVESIDLVKCLMLLPLLQERSNKSSTSSMHHRNGSAEFECKTCNRKFSSFQALGGHRASHKRQKLEDGEEELKQQAKSLSLWNNPKMHECSICGLKFSLGQALGGHMRKHRGLAESSSSSFINHVIEKTPVLMRSNSKRITCLNLDLNLTPFDPHDDSFANPTTIPLPLSFF